LFLNGLGGWTFPNFAVADNSVSLSMLQTVVGNLNKVYTYDINGIPTATLLTNANINNSAGITYN
jgi:hypothetical protein